MQNGRRCLADALEIPLPVFPAFWSNHHHITRTDGSGADGSLGGTAYLIAEGFNFAGNQRTVVPGQGLPGFRCTGSIHICMYV